MSSPKERSARSSNSYRSTASISAFSDRDEDLAAVDPIDQKTAEVMAKCHEIQRMRKHFEADARASAEETMGKLKKLSEAALRLGEMIRKGRARSAQNRETTKNTLGKLYDLMATDSEQAVELRSLQEEIDELSGQIEAVHRNHYRYENFHDAKDIANRTKEACEQTAALERTLRNKGNPEKDKNLFENAAKALMVMANGHGGEVEEKAEELANRLREKAV